MSVDKRPVCWEVYEALRRPGLHVAMGVSEADLRRFAQKVRPVASGCWLWIGDQAHGYGRFVNNLRRLTPAHRFAYELWVGPIPEGLTLDHLCRNPPCVKPAHLEPVTVRINILRSDGLAAKEARQTHCKRGHPFDMFNTRWEYGWRRCRACKWLQKHPGMLAREG